MAATSHTRRTRAFGWLTALALLAGTVLTTTVGDVTPVAADPPALFVVEPLDGGHGFRSGPALEVGLDTLDMALMPDGRIITTEFEGFLRVIDTVANTSTIVAGVEGVNGVPADMVFPTGVGQPADIAVTPSGRIFVVGSTGVPGAPYGINGAIYELDLSARTITMVAGGGLTLWTDGGPALGAYLFPAGLTAIDDDHLAFATGLLSFGVRSAIVSFDLGSGTLTRLVGGGSSPWEDGVAAADLDFDYSVPADFAITPNGDVFFAIGGDPWKAEAATGTVTRLVLVPEGSSGLVANASGELFMGVGGYAGRLAISCRWTRAPERSPPSAHGTRGRSATGA